MGQQGRTPDNQPHPVDVAVGNRLRAARRLIQMSQGTLAERLGITFQQVQKYERGANRVSASKLYEAATALGVSMDYFFADLAKPDTGATAGGDLGIAAFAALQGGLELAHAFRALPAKQRMALVRLTQVMASDFDEEGDAPDLDLGDAHPLMATAPVAGDQLVTH